MPSIELTEDEEQQTRLALDERMQHCLEFGMTDEAQTAFSAYLKVGGYFTWEQIQGFADHAKARRQGS